MKTKNTGLVVARLALATMSIALLTGCEPGSSAGSAESNPEEVSGAAVDTVAVNPTVTEEVVESIEEEPAVTEQGSIAPTPRPELVASDPETVNLDSGEIQLVEFFAFW